MPIEAGAMRRVQAPSRGCEAFGINHLVPRPGNRVMILGSEKQAMQGRRERPTLVRRVTTGATEDAAARRFAAARACRIPWTRH